MMWVILLLVVLAGAGIAVWRLWPQGTAISQSSPTPTSFPSPSAGSPSPSANAPVPTSATSSPSATSSFTASPLPSETALPPSPLADLPYSADFSTPDQGWTEGSYDNGEYRRENGTYRIRVDKADWILYETVGIPLTDFTAELEAQAPAQSDFYYGLIFRQTDGENYYFFQVTNLGYHSLAKRVSGNWTILVDWTRSPAVHTGGVANRLRVSCEGNRIKLLINGYRLPDVWDSSLAAGDLALAVNSRAQTGIATTFNSLRVWSVREAPAMTIDSLEPQLIFSEDFAQPQREWFEGHANDNPNYFLQLEEGGYYFTIGGQGTWIVYNMSGDFPADNTAELQASIQMGNPLDIFGLLVRYQDENNYLGMMVNSAGNYDFVRCLNGELTSLGGPATSSALKTGTVSNRLKVVCQGDHFQFFANGQLLGEVTDRSFPQGQVTFAARRMGTQILRLRFESLKIWALP